MKSLIVVLAIFLIPLCAVAQIDTHPPNHREFPEQMRLPYFLFAEEFQRVCAVHGGFEVITARGDRWRIRRSIHSFIAETDTTPTRQVAEYTPFIFMNGEWTWSARHAGGSGSRTIRRSDARVYRNAGGGCFTRP